METTVAELLQSYNSRYPDQVRSLAEMYCSQTTRLGGMDGVPVQASREDVRSLADEHGVEVDTLRAAITAYSTIEIRSINEHLRGAGKPVRS